MSRGDEGAAGNAAVRTSGRAGERGAGRPAGIPGGRRRVAFFGLAWVSVAFIAASAAPSPIYVLFQAAWHVDSWLLGLAFSIYAFTLLLALLTVGSLSDHLGRRPVLIGAVLAELAALALLLVATDITHVLIARALQGFATGVATATVSAALADLSPARNRQLGATVGSVTPLAGLAVGSLASGLIIQTVDTPIPVVFTALLGVLAVALVFVLAAPETIARRPVAARSLAPRLHVPAGSRPAFLASSFLNVGVWLTTSLVLGLLPQIDRDVFGIRSGIANGGIIALLTGVGAVSVVLSRRFSARQSALVSAIALVAGAAVEAAAIVTLDVGLFSTGAAIAGVGAGVGFSGYIRLVIQTAQPDDRAGVFSAMYVVSYLTFGLPVIVAGIVMPVFGTAPVAVAFCALTIAASAIGFVVIDRYTRSLAGGGRS
ncbi:MFS transporter [Herbiconiux daphne]|uniref:MFS transporter n=1 Tax=Herbiconiux daphne TaxID=2970914 RepID=A0ABT2H5C0_9MICO|nr:MFS transporter [Herbiconiux daphne]MCS5735126.1 MFS transporter [Herbiconiux daphne]